MRGRLRLAVPVVLVLAKAAAAGSGSEVATEESRDETAVAVIVNSVNSCPDPTLLELHEILSLRQQFWKDGKRVILILPTGGSVEKCVLLKTVYHTSDDTLRRDWAQRLFTGEIAAVPSSLRSPDARIGAVRHSAGAVSVVRASEVPPGVRVLLINGKRPGEPGYPIFGGGC